MLVKGKEEREIGGVGKKGLCLSLVGAGIYAQDYKVMV